MDKRSEGFFKAYLVRDAAEYYGIDEIYATWMIDHMMHLRGIDMGDITRRAVTFYTSLQCDIDLIDERERLEWEESFPNVLMRGFNETSYMLMPLLSCGYLPPNDLPEPTPEQNPFPFTPSNLVVLFGYDQKAVDESYEFFCDNAPELLRVEERMMILDETEFTDDEETEEDRLIDDDYMIRHR